MRRLLFLLVVVAGCTKADPVPSASPAPVPAPGVAFAQPPPPTPTPTPAPPPPAPVPLDVTVQLTSVTLADDCGGSTRATSPAPKRSRADISAGAVARRCEQTSMQLAVRASAVARMEIKSVELLDERGTSLGMLTPRSPTRWSDSASRYDAWDETLAADTLVKVSYKLQQPNWSQIGNRWNRTYTLKTVVSIGGVDKSVTKKVTLQAPATLPPNVRT